MKAQNVTYRTEAEKEPESSQPEKPPYASLAALDHLATVALFWCGAQLAESDYAGLTAGATCFSIFIITFAYNFINRPPQPVAPLTTAYNATVPGVRYIWRQLRYALKFRRGLGK